MLNEKKTAPLKTKEFTDALQHDLAELIKRACEISEGSWDDLINIKDNLFADAHPHIYYAAHIFRELENRNAVPNPDEIFKMQDNYFIQASKEYIKSIIEDIDETVNRVKRFYEAFLRYYYNYCWIQKGKAKLGRLGADFPWALNTDYILTYKEYLGKEYLGRKYKLLIQEGKVVSPYLLQKEENYLFKYGRIDKTLLNRLMILGIDNAETKSPFELLDEIKNQIENSKIIAEKNKKLDTIKKDAKLAFKQARLAFNQSNLVFENSNETLEKAEEKLGAGQGQFGNAELAFKRVALSFDEANQLLKTKTQMTLTFLERIAVGKKNILKFLCHFMSTEYKNKAQKKYNSIQQLGITKELLEQAKQKFGSIKDEHKIIKDEHEIIKKDHEIIKKEFEKKEKEYKTAKSNVVQFEENAQSNSSIADLEDLSLSIMKITPILFSKLESKKQAELKPENQIEMPAMFLR